MDYIGALRLDDQPPLEATLRLADDGVTIIADAEPIGTWPLTDCRIIPQGNFGSPSTATRLYLLPINRASFKARSPGDGRLFKPQPKLSRTTA